MTTKIRGKKEQRQRVQDPVCGMPVDPKKSSMQLEQGKEYYFCSEDCRLRFEENPEEYISA
jgi:Cu+-exporting ATPase